MKYKNLQRKIKAGLLVLMLSGFCKSVLGATTAPYSDNFQTTTVGASPSGWTTTAGTWSIVDDGGTHFYQSTLTANSNFASLLEFQDINSTNISSFTISTTFKITDPSTTPSNSRIGFALFANGTSLSSYYLMDITAAGAMRILPQGTNADMTSANLSTFGSLTTGSKYTLSVTGTYTSGSLSMSFTATDVSNPSNSKTITASDPTPYTSQYFGIRNLNPVSSDAFTVQFENFTLTTVSAIPESSSMWLLGCMFSALIGFRSKLNRFPL